MITTKYIDKLKDLNRAVHSEYMFGVDAYTTIFSDLIEEQKYVEVANIHEIMALNFLNTYSLNNFKDVIGDSFYINSRSLNISCLYHYAFGDKNYAENLAKMNYAKHYKYYMEVINPDSAIDKKYKDDFYVAHDLELLGDICIFFNKKLSEKHYKQAIQLYETSTVADAEWALDINLVHYDEALKICFDFDGNLINTMPNRIAKKKKLYEIIK
ncbi:hypothetical protein [Vallitalea sp.]|jgi:hypothetical protein|uniref:hypothetical protein n=1 Tax=Vallitalea sp. TaxID=1882829 RepID=UPI0025CCEE2D|nr:hypothetical protein [Vallitalea sp.]MCT4688375.1 hypothetical protein [Vallitalea sp.]